MATTLKSEKIMVGIDDQVIELTGADKEAFLADREATLEAQRLIEAEQTKKEADRASAMAKLSKLGLTDDEIASLIP
jgi:hypothetical protein